MPTIVAGVALCAAFVSGGLWLVRRGTARKVAAGVMLLALFVCGFSALYADAGVKPPKVTPVTLPADVTLSENLVLEVVEKGDNVKLIVNSTMLPKPVKKDK